MIDETFWNHLAKEGWACLDSALPRDQWLSWARSLETKFGRGLLRPATITSLKNPDRLRGDHLFWLDQDPSPEGREAELWLEEFRLALNQNLFLALKRSEAHWTLYPAGAAYDWHLDQHQSHDHRRMSFILYLNENWMEQGWWSARNAMRNYPARHKFCSPGRSIDRLSQREIPPPSPSGDPITKKFNRVVSRRRSLIGEVH